jgi:hypothetical protein
MYCVIGEQRWRSRYSNWLWAGRPRGRISSLGRSRISLIFTSSSQPPIQWVAGILSPEVKRPGHEADHPRPTSAEFNNTWIYTSTPLYVFVA